ncbi:MAG: hypothetical protein J2P37_09250 [Ktedonobacteraceae bacterium]|nr:hypothetical protein [Ktedonobacteraceae bacterium]
MYTPEEYRAKLEEVHAANLLKVPPTENTVREARERLHNAREQVAQAEAEAREQLAPNALLYMRHDLRAQHIAGINARVSAAKDALRAAQEHFNEVSRDATALALEARKRSREFEQKAEQKRKEAQAEHAKEQEAEAKEQFRARYLASGGTEAGFAAAWPAMWAKELERRTLQEDHTYEARLRASGRYAF